MADSREETVIGISHKDADCHPNQAAPRDCSTQHFICEIIRAQGSHNKVSQMQPQLNSKLYYI